VGKEKETIEMRRREGKNATIGINIRVRACARACRANLTFRARFVLNLATRVHRYSGADCFAVNGNITAPFKPLNGSSLSPSLSLSLYIYMYLFNCYAMVTPRLRRRASPYSIAFTFTSTTADVYEPPADVRATCCSLAFIARAHALAFRHRHS